MTEDKKSAVRAVETGERKDRVLIVEDEENARKGYEQLLQRWGCEVLGVGTAEDALAKFGGFQPDALIADVELPGMNGLDLLKQLGPELTDVPAVIITGKGSEEVAVECMRAGAADYIVKPFDNENLLAVIRNVLRLRESELQRRKLNAELQDVNHRLQQYVGDLERNLQIWSDKKLEIDYLLTRAMTLVETRPSDFTEITQMLTEIRSKL